MTTLRLEQAGRRVREPQLLPVMAGVLVLVLLLAGCTTHAASSGWQFVDVDHQRTGAVARPVSGDGPAPGVMHQQWRIVDIPATGPAAYATPGLYLTAGVLVVVTGWGVLGYDAATGARLWHYREPGRQIWAAATAGTVVIATEPAHLEVGADTSRLVGLDAASGRLRWTRHNQGRVELTVNALTTAGPVLPVLDANRLEANRLTGLDVRTGQPAWVSDYEPDGPAYLNSPRRSDGSLLLLRDGDLQSQLRAYLPATGALLWTKRFDEQVSPSRIGIYDRTVMLRLDDRLHVVESDGTSRSMPVDPLTSYDPVGYFLPVHGEADEGTTLIDVRTGQPRSRGWPSTVGQRPAFGQDGVLYTVDSRGPVPGLSRGLPAGGPAWMPLPLPGFTDRYASPDDPVWTGVAGGRLLVARQQSGEPLQVYGFSSRPAEGPVELGGVPYHDWPDPCQAGHMDGATGRTEPIPRPPNTLGEVELPAPGCRVFIEDRDRGGSAAIEVYLIWVADTAEIADTWLSGTPGPAGVDEVDDHDHYLFARIGPTIVEVRSYDGIDPETVLERLAAIWSQP